MELDLEVEARNALKTAQISKVVGKLVVSTKVLLSS